ncbi:MAG: hypothetical protein KDD45_08805 [Bdellovibrionales bacterium]|nr:hypothetical protein [Bdellovibrionales bacterium]
MKLLFFYIFSFYLITSDCLAASYIYLDDQKTLGVIVTANPNTEKIPFFLFKFSPSDLSKNLLDALQTNLKLFINGEPVDFYLQKPINGAEIGYFNVGQQLLGSRVKIILGDKIISDFTVGNRGKIRNNSASPISSYDLRQIAEIGSQYLKNNLDTKYSTGSIIDLHTHFGGALRGESIVRVAYKLGLFYPTSFLKQMGIVFDYSKVNDNGEIKISDLDSGSLYKLIDNLNLNTLKVESFSRMEVYYKYRSPLVKSIQAFPLLLKELALDYKKNGVKYAELSISDVLKPEWLELVHQHMPQIEKETSVKIRFLAALWRHSDPLYNNDMIERLKILQSPYIVGVDFMGHESNSSWELEPTIKKAVELKEMISPDFQIRVHAGENPYFPENVRVAIELGADRIGHALYADETAISLAKKKGTIFEINPDSNFALNNNDGVEQAPLSKFISSGINLTVGTDGHGLYGINHRNLLRPLVNSKVATNELQKMAQNDYEYISKMDKMFAKRTYLLSQPVSRNLPKGEYTAEYERQQNDRLKIDKIELINNLRAKGIEIHESTKSIENKFKGMDGIWISGASKSSFPKIAPQDQMKIEQMLLDDLKKLDPSKVFLIMGITHFGVEEIIMRLNEKYNLGLKILGTIAEDKSETKIEDIGKVTDAIFMGKKWFDKAGSLVPFVKKMNFLAFFIGGGGVIRDEIQAAKNAGLDFHLLKGPWGASTDMSIRYPSHIFNYKSGIAGVVESKRPNLIKLSPAKKAADLLNLVKQRAEKVVVNRCLEAYM